MKILLQKHWKIVIGTVIGSLIIGSIGVWIGRTGQTHDSLVALAQEKQEKEIEVEHNQETAPVQVQFDPLEKELLAINQLDLKNTLLGLAKTVNGYESFLKENNMWDMYNWSSRVPASIFIRRSLDDKVITVSDFPFIAKESFSYDLESMYSEKKAHAYLQRLWNIEEETQNATRSIILACADDVTNFYAIQGLCVRMIFGEMLQYQAQERQKITD